MMTVMKMLAISQIIPCACLIFSAAAFGIENLHAHLIWLVAGELAGIPAGIIIGLPRKAKAGEQKAEFRLWWLLLSVLVGLAATMALTLATVFIAAWLIGETAFEGAGMAALIFLAIPLAAIPSMLVGRWVYRKRTPANQGMFHQHL